MKCITCESWSFSIICKTCQKKFLTPTLYKRQLDDNFFVYSFYKYEELEDLMRSKYYFHGDRVLTVLAKLTFAKFAQEFSYESDVLAIPLDDHTRHEFSHTAILAKHLDSSNIHPSFNHLKASNKIKYAGKNLEYRQKNPRRFKVNDLSNQTLILVDDIVTTGTTLLEAKKVCGQAHNKLLFALCLADAK